jgi:hypothetical protein
MIASDAFTVDVCQVCDGRSYWHGQNLIDDIILEMWSAWVLKLVPKMQVITKHCSSQSPLCL